MNRNKPKIDTPHFSHHKKNTINKEAELQKYKAYDFILNFEIGRSDEYRNLLNKFASMKNRKQKIINELKKIKKHKNNDLEILANQRHTSKKEILINLNKKKKLQSAIKKEKQTKQIILRSYPLASSSFEFYLQTESQESIFSFESHQ